MLSNRPCAHGNSLYWYILYQYRLFSCQFKLYIHNMYFSLLKYTVWIIKNTIIIKTLSLNPSAERPGLDLWTLETPDNINFIWSFFTLTDNSLAALLNVYFMVLLFWRETVVVFIFVKATFFFGMNRLHSFFHYWKFFFFCWTLKRHFGCFTSRGISSTSPPPACVLPRPLVKAGAGFKAQWKWDEPQQEKKKKKANVFFWKVC